MSKNNQLQDQNIRKLDNYCCVCEKGFINYDKFAHHLSYSHVICHEKNCNYSAPKEIMYYHRLKHINNKEGNSITESTEEIEKWLTSRKINFPRSDHSLKDSLFRNQNSNETYLKKKNQNTQMSALEHYLRINMSQQAYFSHNKKLNKLSNKKYANCNSNLKTSIVKKKEKPFQSKKINKSLLFKLFESEIRIYERKMISAVNYLIKSY